MTELKPCPFCGGKPVLVTDAPECFVYCPHCDQTANFPEQAIEKWNTRYERTCHLNKMDRGHMFPLITCSECGHEVDEGDDAIYCWYCGAKVVRE